MERKYEPSKKRAETPKKQFDINQSFGKFPGDKNSPEKKDWKKPPKDGGGAGVKRKPTKRPPGIGGAAKVKAKGR